MPSTVWRGQLTFGLVSVPVRLHRAARKERIRLRSLGRQEQQSEAVSDVQDGTRRFVPIQGVAPSAQEVELESIPPVTRLKQTFVAPGDRPVLPQEVLKGYEIAPDQYVTLRRDELLQLRQATSPTMEILRTTRVAEIDPVYFETSYYVVPEPTGERAYALLYAALQETAYAALARVAMHGREHIMLVRPATKGLLAHTLYYTDELRAENEYPAKMTDVAARELALAKTFIEAIAGPFAPEEFTDKYREQLRELIAAKTARQEIAPSIADAERAPGPIVDIMEALAKSLERAKQTTPAPTPRRPPGAATRTKTQRRKA